MAPASQQPTPKKAPPPTPTPTPKAPPPTPVPKKAPPPTPVPKKAPPPELPKSQLTAPKPKPPEPPCRHDQVTTSGSNQYVQYISCRDCHVRLSKLDKRTGEVEHFTGFGATVCSVPQCHDVYFQDVEEHMIADSGCKRSVAGKMWHDQLRQKLAAEGLQPVKKAIREKFRFGDGRVVKAHTSWTYPTGLYGRHGQVNVAEVDVECPPLLSVRAMEELGMVLNFWDSTVSILSADAHDKPMIKAKTGHPIIKITDYSENHKFPDEFLTYYAESNTGSEGEGWTALKHGAKKRLSRITRSLEEVFACSASEQPAHKDPEPRRKKRWSFKVMEFFTWTMVVTTVALAQGWQSGPPITIETGYDLRSKKGQAEALKIYHKEDPDFAVIAPPCSPWSQMQNLTMSRPGRRDEVMRQRAADMPFLQFSERIATEQADKGKFFALEQPKSSKMLVQPPLQRLRKRFQETTVHMCTQDLRDPYTQELLRKSSLLVHNSPAIHEAFVDATCDKVHGGPSRPPHKAIEGNTWTQDDKGSWKAVKLSSFAGGYTKTFAKNLLQAVRTDLVGQGTYPVQDDEDFQAKRRRLETYLPRVHRPNNFQYKRQQQEQAETDPLKRRRKWLEAAQEAARLANQRVLGGVEPPTSTSSAASTTPSAHQVPPMVATDAAAQQPSSSNAPPPKRQRRQNPEHEEEVGPVGSPTPPGQASAASHGSTAQVTHDRAADDSHSSTAQANRGSQPRNGSTEQVIHARAAGREQPSNGSTEQVIHGRAEADSRAAQPQPSQPGEDNPPTSSQPPVERRGRGRPPGSRNRATLAREAERDRLAREDQESLRRQAEEAIWEPLPDEADDLPLPSREEDNPDQVEGWEHEAETPEDWRRSFDETMTCDPCLQPAGEEIGNMSQAIRDKLALIPDTVKHEVRRAHHQLGHLGRDALLRLARNAGKSPDHLFYIKHWQCPVCLRRAAPAPVVQASGRDRPQEFNMLVGVDLKEVQDAEGERHTFLNILDVATRYSVFVRVSNKSSAGVAKKFMKHWVGWAGAPTQIVHDQGGEFFKDFAAQMRRLGLNPRVTPTEAPWQNGMVERHGGVLGEILSVMVEQAQLTGEADMTMGGAMAAAAKNRRPDRSGHSARGRTFGTEERFPGSVVDALLEGENPVEMEEALTDPIFRRTLKIRTAAMEAIVKLDADARWQRLMASGIRKKPQEWQPGAQVFFWRAQKAPQTGRGRRARMFKRWHGPAVVLGQQRNGAEGSEAYWLGQGGTLYLVAAEHLRAATREESLADAVMNQVLADMRGMLAMQRPMLRYRDLRRQAADDLEGAPEEVEADVDVDPVIAAMNQPPAAEEVPQIPEEGEPDAEMGAPTPVLSPERPVRPAPAEEPGEEEVEPPAQRPRLEAADIPVPEDVEGSVSQYVFLLQNKSSRKGQKGKELDPRYFSDAEWESFVEADKEQWQAHIKSGAVRVLSAAQAAKVDPKRILPIPARFVRTNKDKSGRLLIAKSRFVVPGHLAPKDDIRTDAPVAPQSMLYVLFSWVVNFEWDLGTFDVKDAFLSGKDNPRSLFVRPPREGIKGLPHGCLIEMIKGVFGLKESPRLWWLQLRDAVLEAGFEELRYVPGCFVIRERDGSVCGLLCVHVDDGVWGGKGETYQKAQEKLRKLINIKVEKTGEFEILGRRVTHTPNEIKVDQFEYVKKIKTVFVPAIRRKMPNASLLPQEVTQLQSLTQQLAWPARTTMPGLAYLVSELQQKTSKATVSELVRANWVLRHAQEMARNGQCLKFRRFNKPPTPQDLAISFVHDASFANQTDWNSQQGYLVMVTTPEILEGETDVHVVDWSSSTIHRKVRSTLAAEAASGAHAYDRGTYIRVLLSEMVNGSEGHWTEQARGVPAYMGSDCRSLVDHCAKTGASVSEKRVGLDIADIRDGIEAGDILRWIPTLEMPADILTKHLTDARSLLKLMMDNRFSLKWAIPKKRKKEKARRIGEASHPGPPAGTPHCKAQAKWKVKPQTEVKLEMPTLRGSVKQAVREPHVVNYVSTEPERRTEEKSSGGARCFALWPDTHEVYFDHGSSRKRSREEDDKNQDYEEGDKQEAEVPWRPPAASQQRPPKDATEQPPQKQQQWQQQQWQQQWQTQEWQQKPPQEKNRPKPKEELDMQQLVGKVTDYLNSRSDDPHEFKPMALMQHHDGQMSIVCPCGGRLLVRRLKPKTACLCGRQWNVEYFPYPELKASILGEQEAAPPPAGSKQPRLEPAPPAEPSRSAGPDPRRKRHRGS